MSKIQLLLLITIFFCLNKSLAQNHLPKKQHYTKEQLWEFINWKFSINPNKKKCEIYILDGVPFSEEKIDSELESYNKKDIGLLTLFDKSNDSISSTNICDLIIVINTYNQENKIKRKTLKNVKEIFNENVPKIIIRDWFCIDCPLLSINNKIIWNPYERKKILNNLKIKNISRIYYTNQPLNPVNFGKVGKKGIIEIVLN